MTSTDMNNPAKLLAAIALSVSIDAGAAHAQQTGAIDGVYVGTSAALAAANSGRHCPGFPRPGPLTISKGAARLKWGESEILQGQVGSQGTLEMRSDFGTQLSGRLDGRGGITAQISRLCVYDLAWQKR